MRHDKVRFSSLFSWYVGVQSHGPHSFGSEMWHVGVHLVWRARFQQG
jgi:hypothetical protein